MDYLNPRNRRMHPLSVRERQAATYPPAYSETDSCYFSDSTRSDPAMSDVMSESDWSRDTPPYFKEEPIRENNLTMASTKEQCSEAALKEKVSLQPVEFAIVLIVVVAVFYFACSLLSRETVVNVKIVLQGSSGEDKSAIVIEELLNQILKQQNREVKTGVQVEIQTGRDTRHHNAKDSGYGFGFKFFVLLFLVFFAIKVYQSDPQPN